MMKVKPQLFLLHFAGGNCYSFKFMEGLLNDFEVFSLELPGRGKRMSEELLTDFDLAAEDIYRQISALLKTDTFFIYGHSMGAYLSLRVGNKLESNGKMPAGLIVSGNAGPGIVENKKTYLLDQGPFIDALVKLGGLPQEIIDNEELIDFFEPVLRADFQVAEDNRMKNEPPVNAPIYAIMGSEEEHVSEITNWQRFTHNRFAYEVLEGNHFFIHKHPNRIAGIIKGSYNQVALPQS